MAAVSALHDGGSFPSSRNLQREHGAWEFSVPVTHEQSRNFSFPKSYATNDNHSRRAPTPQQQQKEQQLQSEFQIRSHHTDGVPGPQRIFIQPDSPGQFEQAQPQPQPGLVQNTTSTYLVPYATDGLGRRLGDISRSGSECDSLLDLYNHRRSMFNPIDDNERAGMVGEPYLDGEELDSSRWIHRDKLAMIESQEMQQAGFTFPRPETSRSSSNRRREHSRDQYSNGIRPSSSDVPHARQENWQRMQSPSPEQREIEAEGNHAHYNLPSPEETAAEPNEEINTLPLYRQPGMRASPSRIPILTSSPLPIPQEHLERDTPLPRKRVASGNWSGGDEDGLAYPKIRRRSQSLGSQALFDSREPPNNASTPRSRPVSRGLATPSAMDRKTSLRAGPVSGERSTSTASRAVSTSQKPRTTSATHRSSPAQRPHTRPGPDGRPATAVNRPEGEAPWLATMYKPDPRLPPEQQMLPTHAKRLQQEQWEKEGKSGPAFDGESTPLPAHTQDNLQPPSPAGGDKPEGTKADGNQAWPLKPAPKPPSMISRAETNGTEHGGYSTIPRVQGLPGTPSLSKVSSPIPPQQPFQMQDPPKEKACGCCVMM
ncbi:hypothetical protein LPUS_04235 [Lasallia pustulata]|uniref:Uncharacterized protein n=1 Tax=Lasallia pustulata TaxID=136370 RepID=A0A1W5CWK8_9LECA|nr:hypothetical protein LPUS_04235 [Lasallia pustulata]